jgi:hypothetical protein
MSGNIVCPTVQSESLGAQFYSIFALRTEISSNVTAMICLSQLYSTNKAKTSSSEPCSMGRNNLAAE